MDPVRAASPVERRRELARLWQSYIQDAIQPAGLRDEILRSWRRTESYGIEPGLVMPRRELSPDALEERCAKDEALQLALPILRDFEHQVPDHALAYFDAEGWLLYLVGDQEQLRKLREIHFRPGVSWAEESAGTNGPGTALAACQPVEVFASEHFVAAWQLWSCAAAPILSPDSQAPLGIIDLTAPWEKHSRLAINVAKGLARAVAERIHAVKSLKDEAVRQALRAGRETGDALVAVDAAGRVIGRNDAASRRRFLHEPHLPPAAQEALARTFFSREASPEDDGTISLGDGQIVHASAVRHQGSAVGAILRIAAESGARPTRTKAHPTVRYRFECILGRTEAIRHTVTLARTTAGNELPVVLTGESGTGKELFAQSIHAASVRRSGPFVAVNCGSIPPQLVEAELFGYEAGSFTGAKQGGSSGRFEEADGGTLFLDEVSELPRQAQTALLRLLQEKEVVRIGGGTPRHVDVRVIAATNKRLEEEVLAKRFRRDLYYRLNVLPISLPPLRERGADIPLLAQAFLAAAAKDLGRHDLEFSPDALQGLCAHRWPGNIRELKNVVLRVAATAPRSQITAADLAFDPEPVGGQGRPLWDALRKSFHKDADTANRLYDAILGSDEESQGAGHPDPADALDVVAARRWVEGILRELRPLIPGQAGPAARAQGPADPLGGEPPQLPAGAPPGPAAEEPARNVTLREAMIESERARLLEALDECGWNFGRAARRLGIARSTLYRLLHKNKVTRMQRPPISESR